MKSVSLQELPDIYIESGLSLKGLCEYLKVSEGSIRSWAKKLDLFSEDDNEADRIYSKDKIQEFSKIKGLVDRGKPFDEIKETLYGVQRNQNTSIEVLKNPFENMTNLPEFKQDKQDYTSKPEKGLELRPLITQLHRSTSKIESLLLERTKIIENAAVEKADLIAKIEILTVKNDDLIKEKDQLKISLLEKDQELKNHLSQSSTLGESLVITHELLKNKEEELSQLRGQIKACEEELIGKDNLIYQMEGEINHLLEKQNKKWWKFW